MTEAYIYDAVRSPRGKGKKDGSLHEVTSVRMAANALNEIKDRNNLDTAEVEDVIMGCVMQVGEQSLNVGRNVDEIVRLIDGLQTSDEHSVACPVN